MTTEKELLEAIAVAERGLPENATPDEVSRLERAERLVTDTTVRLAQKLGLIRFAWRADGK